MNCWKILRDLITKYNSNDYIKVKILNIGQSAAIYLKLR